MLSYVQVYSDLNVDYFKMFLLNVPAAVIALTLWVISVHMVHAISMIIKPASVELFYMIVIIFVHISIMFYFIHIMF